MKKALFLLMATVCMICCLGCHKQALTTPLVDGWSVDSSQYRTLSDGVEYMQIRYLDDEGLPYMIYVLSIDPKKAELHTGTAQNNCKLLSETREDVAEHMQASVSDGLPVIAGVNGDFFSSNMSSGLCIKEGIIIRDNTNFRPYFAFTYDSKYHAYEGTLEKLDLKTIKTAVGGSHVIVKNGTINNTWQNSELGSTKQPRTLSGARSDGTILLVVIDGRQPKHSNGASLTTCAKLMLALGADEAINHDGGGSSTMVLHNTDEYQIVNSPSDGAPRKVYNSIQVVLK